MTPERAEKKRLRAREYYRANAEAKKAWQRAYREEHREEIAAKRRDSSVSEGTRARRRTPAYREKHRAEMREWREKNPEKARDAAARHRASHKDSPKRKAYEKAYRKENAEKIRAAARQRYLAEREVAILRAKKTRESDPEKWTAYQREYRTKNSERIKARIRAWYRTPGGQSISKHHSLKRRALVPDVPARLIEARFELFDNKCAYCGSEGPLHVDHLLAVAKGGKNDEKNLVPACRRCNLSKKTRPWQKWYREQPFYRRWRAVRIARAS